MNTNYKAAATKFEIYDNDLMDLIAKIECMDEACVTIDLRGAFNVHNFMQLVPHIADAMRKMELEGDDYSLIDASSGADWKGAFERLEHTMQYEHDVIKEIKEERDILQLKFAELTDTFEEMKKERDTLQSQRKLLIEAVQTGADALLAYEPVIRKAGLMFGNGENAIGRMRLSLNVVGGALTGHVNTF